jgi:DNA anti-recombination protein RmuC
VISALKDEVGHLHEQVDRIDQRVESMQSEFIHVNDRLDYIPSALTQLMTVILLLNQRKRRMY